MHAVSSTGPGRRRSALLAILVVLLAGLGFIAASYAGSDRTFSLSSLLYDLGMGAFTATAVAAVLSLHLSRIEKAEQQRARRAEEQLLAREREVERRWNQIASTMSRLDAEMNHALIEDHLNKLEHALDVDRAHALGLHDDVRGVLRRLDRSDDGPAAGVPPPRAT